MTLALVVDASVALKWVLNEEDSAQAVALARSAETLLLPDFWLNEATNVLWLAIRRGRLTQALAAQSLEALQAAAPVVPTADLALHARALDIAVEARCSPYDALYAAFALAVGADHVIAADRPFLTALRRHGDPAVSRLALDLHDWATS